MSAKSKTQSALDLLATNPKMSAYAAAKATGLSLSVMYRAVDRKNRPCCKECGRPLTTNLGAKQVSLFTPDNTDDLEQSVCDLMNRSVSLLMNDGVDAQTARYIVAGNLRKTDNTLASLMTGHKPRRRA